MDAERTMNRAATLLMGSALALILALPVTATAQGRGVQFAPDGSGRVLVNKDVGVDRFAITKNPDGSLTGNVFRTDGSDPIFLVCTPLVPANTYTCSAADPCQDLGSGPARGIQRTPDLQIVLVNKDVGTDRFAISLNADGTVSGNVFRENEPSPAFIHCTPTGQANEFSCSGADTCVTETCVDQYTVIGNVTLPSDFFDVPSPCNEPFLFTSEVTLPANFFVPPETVTFSITASEGVQGFTIDATYPTPKGAFSGSADGVGCFANGDNFVGNDTDDGNLRFVMGKATDLTLPIDITCTFDETEGMDLAAGDIGVDVVNVTQNAASGNTMAVGVNVAVQ